VYSSGVTCTRRARVTLISDIKYHKENPGLSIHTHILDPSTYQTQTTLSYLVFAFFVTKYFDSGFEVYPSDTSIYISKDRKVFLVDDILIFSPNKDCCTHVCEYLTRHFTMNILCEPTTFLGLNITRDRIAKTITINDILAVYIGFLNDECQGKKDTFGSIISVFKGNLNK
jgi:hypothetical protein